MMKEVLTSLKHLPTPPGLHPQVSQYHSLTITSLTNPEYTPRTKKLVKYDPGFIFKFYKVENGQEHPCRSCMLKSDTIVPKNVKNSQLGTVFRLPKTVKTLMLKSSVSSTKYKKALGNEIAGASDNKVPINSSVRKLMTSEGRCTRRVITDKVSSARCGTCRQLVVNPDTVRYKSPPQGAVEEFTEMSDPKVLHFEGGDFAGEDSMPQYKLTGCTLYNRVLLDDDSDLTVELTSPTITFIEGLTMDPEENSESYFAGLDLVAYKNSLFVRRDGQVGGEKTFGAGKTITVEGDLSFGDNILLFGVDLPSLDNAGLKISPHQTIDVEYTINTMSQVEKIYTETIADTIVDDICVTDEDCAITCPDETTSTCATFQTTVTSAGVDIRGTLEGINVSSVVTKLGRSEKAYNLDVLVVPNGDLSWLTESGTADAVSDLYSNLVVRSDKDWCLEEEAVVVQEISGDVEFLTTVTFNDVTLDSNIINEDTANAVNPEAIIEDGASKRPFSANVFTSSKTFLADVQVNTATVASLADVFETNDINITDYRAAVLLVDVEVPAEDPFEQEVREDWTLLNGVMVGDMLSGAGTVDGVEVEDLVRVDIVEEKEIPAVTFEEGAIVAGDIVTTGTDFQTRMDDFFTDTIKTDDDSTISQNLKFTGEVSVSSAVNVTKLNVIPASTWVVTGQDTTEQVITAGKIFAKDVTVKENVFSDDIANSDLSAKYADALKPEEDAVISGPSVEFSTTTTLLEENLEAPMGDLIDTLINDFVPQVGGFVDELYTYYTANKASHVVPLETRLINKNKEIFFSEYLKHLACQALTAFSLGYATYCLMECSETPFMHVIYEKSFLVKLRVQFLDNANENHIDAQYEDLQSHLGLIIPPVGMNPIGDETFLRHADFVVNQVVFEEYLIGFNIHWVSLAGVQF